MCSLLKDIFLIVLLALAVLVGVHGLSCEGLDPDEDISVFASSRIKNVDHNTRLNHRSPGMSAQRSTEYAWLLGSDGSPKTIVNMLNMPVCQYPLCYESGLVTHGCMPNMASMSMPLVLRVISLVFVGPTGPGMDVLTLFADVDGDTHERMNSLTSKVVMTQPDLLLAFSRGDLWISRKPTLDSLAEELLSSATAATMVGSFAMMPMPYLAGLQQLLQPPEFKRIYVWLPMVTLHYYTLYRTVRLGIKAMFPVIRPFLLGIDKEIVGLVRGVIGDLLRFQATQLPCSDARICPHFLVRLHYWLGQGEDSNGYVTHTYAATSRNDWNMLGAAKEPASCSGRQCTNQCPDAVKQDEVLSKMFLGMGLLVMADTVLLAQWLACFWAAYLIKKVLLEELLLLIFSQLDASHWTQSARVVTWIALVIVAALIGSFIVSPVMKPVISLATTAISLYAISWALSIVTSIFRIASRYATRICRTRRMAPLRAAFSFLPAAFSSWVAYTSSCLHTFNKIMWPVEESQKEQQNASKSCNSSSVVRERAQTASSIETIVRPAKPADVPPVNSQSAGLSCHVNKISKGKVKGGSKGEGKEGYRGRASLGNTQLTNSIRDNVGETKTEEKLSVEAVLNRIASIESEARNAKGRNAKEPESTEDTSNEVWNVSGTHTKGSSKTGRLNHATSAELPSPSTQTASAGSKPNGKRRSGLLNASTPVPIPVKPIATTTTTTRQYMPIPMGNGSTPNHSYRAVAAAGTVPTPAPMRVPPPPPPPPPPRRSEPNTPRGSTPVYSTGTPIPEPPPPRSPSVREQQEEPTFHLPSHILESDINNTIPIPIPVDKGSSPGKIDLEHVLWPYDSAFTPVYPHFTPAKPSTESITFGAPFGPYRPLLYSNVAPAGPTPDPEPFDTLIPDASLLGPQRSDDSFSIPSGGASDSFQIPSDFGTKLRWTAQMLPALPRLPSSLPGSVDVPTEMPWATSASKARRGDGDAVLCVICLDAPRQVGLMHGQDLHLCVCRTCADHLETGAPCPLCRAPVERALLVYT